MDEAAAEFTGQAVVSTKQNRAASLHGQSPPSHGLFGESSPGAGENEREVCIKISGDDPPLVHDPLTQWTA